jgi:3-oxoacyl-[acyl-carrier protein] reductase
MRQVVVTGGGTGIGLAVAGEFVRAGDSVTITGRREHVLKEAAVEAWAADVAAELGPRGITANVVSPGLTLGSEFFRDGLTDARRERLVAETRTGRAGTTADVAATVMFLASPAAGHLTGQVIHVNGGAYLGR